MTNQLKVTAPDGLPFVEFERDLDAPVASVFRAHQDPGLVEQWLGPARYEMEIEMYDFRTGGRYRYVHRNDQGEEYRFNGVFRAVRENEVAIQTFEYEEYPDVVSLDHLVFEDLGDRRTRLRGRSVFPSLEARDGMVQSGMESGMAEGYERLDKVLASL